jgi:uncharacterized protein
LAVSGKDQPRDGTSQSASDRIIGYDVARALAILGMVLVHFMIALALPVKSLAATGRMAFTWYVTHIMLGLGTVEWLGLQSSQSLGVAVAAGFGFFLAAIVISLLWFRFFRYGPLEWLMRRVAG